MLSTAAFNAFLKTLEEPPHHAIFVLCTTEKQKILPTILSRCQTYDFQRITVQDIADQLQRIAMEEGINAEPAALQVIARKADGGMRDALSVFDQIVSFTDGNVTRQATIDNLNILDYDIFFRITDDALSGNIPAALMLLDEVIRKGFDAQIFIGGWAGHLRDLMVSQDPATLSLVEAGADVAMRYQQQAVKCPPAFLYQSLQIASDCDFNYRNSRNKRLSVELAIVKICQLMHPVSLPNAVAPASQPTTVTQPRPAQQVAPRPMAQPTPHVAAAPQPHPQAQPVQQTPAPAPQPAPQPQRLGSGPDRFAARPGGMHLTSIRVAPQQSAANPGAAAVQEIHEMNEPVQPDALRRAWKEYISTNPAEKLLNNVMAGHLPQQVEGTQYEVTLASGAQQEIIEAHRMDILRYIQQKMSNTHIVINYVVSEEMAAKRAFSPREKIQDMMSSNQAISDLINTFKLEIG